MKNMIIGNKGQLGWALERRAAIAGISTRCVDLPELDLTNREAVQQMVARDRCSVVVNAAAYTAVDKAESNRDAAFAVNRDGVAHLAEACREYEIPLIHVSTDYVFNGKGTRPYQANDLIDPLGVYGRSKAEGEKEVRGRLNQHLIIRTSWLYGIHGQNFVKTMLRLAKEKKEIRVVADQQGCPTFANDLADAIIRIVERVAGGKDDVAWGTYHYCNWGVTTWYQFAKRAIELASNYEKFTVEKIIPITTADYPTPAPRPAYSALDCSSFVSAFGVKTLPWEERLEEMITLLSNSNIKKSRS